MRFLWLYLRSRQIPATCLAIAGAAAAMWLLGLGLDHQAHSILALMTVLAGSVTVAPGLAGADVTLDRGAAIAWLSRRTAHALVAIGAVAGTATITGLGDTGYVIRAAIGLGGLTSTGAVILGASRAWILPVGWTMLSLTVFAVIWPGSTNVYQRAVTWMLEPAASAPGMSVAITLGLTGVLAYAVGGPGPRNLRR